MKISLGYLVLCLSALTLRAQTFTDTFTSAPSGPPFSWGIQAMPGQGTGALWYANGHFEYSATGGTAYPGGDGMTRQLGDYVGTQSGNWSISVDFGLTPAIPVANFVDVFLSVGVPGQFLSVGSIKSTASNQFFYQSGVTPISVGSPSGTSTGTLRIDYTASTTTLVLFANGSSIYTQDISSWFTGHPEYLVGFSLGGSSFNSVGSSPVVAGVNSYFDNFTASGPGLQASAVPEPSTYAAIMGVAVLGMAAIRRRKKS